MEDGAKCVRLRQVGSRASILSGIRQSLSQKKCLKRSEMKKSKNLGQKNLTTLDSTKEGLRLLSGPERGWGKSPRPAARVQKMAHFSVALTRTNMHRCGGAPGISDGILTGKCVFV